MMNDDDDNCFQPFLSILEVINLRCTQCLSAQAYAQRQVLLDPKSTPVS